jgi:hypothetical protein
MCRRRRRDGRFGLIVVVAVIVLIAACCAASPTVSFIRRPLGTAARPPPMPSHVAASMSRHVAERERASVRAGHGKDLARSLEITVFPIDRKALGA